MLTKGRGIDMKGGKGDLIVGLYVLLFWILTLGAFTLLFL
jgi:hypothetical protein